MEICFEAAGVKLIAFLHWCSHKFVPGIPGSSRNFTFVLNKMSWYLHSPGFVSERRETSRKMGKNVLKCELETKTIGFLIALM